MDKMDDGYADFFSYFCLSFSLITNKTIIMKRFLCYSIFFLSMTMSYALTFTVDDITYTTFGNGNKVKVTGFNFSLINVVIPSSVEYNGVQYIVKSIGPKGLKGFKTTASPKSKMQTLVISEGIEIIESNGVISNSSLTSVFLPSTLIEIGDSAFISVPNLNSVTFPNGSSLNRIGAGAFMSCSFESFIIPSSVSYIGKYAFASNKLLSSIAIPENVTVIQESTFNGCTSLYKVTLHHNLKRVESNAFNNCKSLEIIDNKIIGSLDYIGSSAFYGVPGIQKLILNGNLGTIPASTFARCKNLEYVWLQEGITSIGTFAFGTCRNLKYIVLPSTIQEVKSGAFGESEEKLLDYQIHGPRNFFILADEPFDIQYSLTTSGYYDAFPSLGMIADGDRFYVKESAEEAYKIKWRYTSNIVYKIPFDASHKHSTNIREFDTDFHVTGKKGNKPFVATSYDKNMVYFTSIDDGIVPAETAVLIRKQSNANTWYQIAEQQGVKKLNMTNYLHGFQYSYMIDPEEDNGDINYVLYNGIFCTFLNTGLLGDHKACLTLPASAYTKQLNMQFEEQQVTDVEHVSIQENENPVYYNLQGMRVMNPGKGIYIVNNKKVIIK